MRIVPRNFAVALLIVFAAQAGAQDAADKKSTIALEGGKYVLEAPKDWKKEQPKSSMTQYEFSAPADAKEGAATARITVTTLRGNAVEPNIQRWKDQFENAAPDKTKVEKFEAGKRTIHWVDIQGSFKESTGGGPFAPGKIVVRDDYRMLGAILETDAAMHFVKVIGPADVVEKLADGTKKMLKDLQAK